MRAEWIPLYNRKDEKYGEQDLVLVIGYFSVPYSEVCIAALL